MQKSARILGQDYGLTAGEMNYTLFKLGFLEGSPGNYSLTEKAMKYAAEKDFHRGTGGYSKYNRRWTTRTFDDSIKDVLDITPELISEVRKELADIRAAQAAARALARKQALAEYMAKQAAEKASKEELEKAAAETMLKWDRRWKNTGKICLITSGVMIAGYAVYKIVPKIQKRYNNRSKKNEEE